MEKFKKSFLFFSDSGHPTSFDDLDTVLNQSDPSHRIVQGQVHIMVVPWSMDGLAELINELPGPQFSDELARNFNTKFKIMRLSSC